MNRKRAAAVQVGLGGPMLNLNSPSLVGPDLLVPSCLQQVVLTRCGMPTRWRRYEPPYPESAAIRQPGPRRRSLPRFWPPATVPGLPSSGSSSS